MNRTSYVQGYRLDNGDRDVAPRYPSVRLNTTTLPPRNTATTVAQGVDPVATRTAQVVNQGQQPTMEKQQ